MHNIFRNDKLTRERVWYTLFLTGMVVPVALIIATYNPILGVALAGFQVPFVIQTVILAIRHHKQTPPSANTNTRKSKSKFDLQ
jgi:hypothetical protein